MTFWLSPERSALQAVLALFKIVPGGGGGTLTTKCKSYLPIAMYTLRHRLFFFLEREGRVKTFHKQTRLFS